MMNKEQVVVITGASDGIGKAAAELFANNGYKVYGLNRRPVESERIAYIRIDITDFVSVKKAVESIFENEGRIDILVNNAGTGISGSIEFSKEDDAVKQMDINFFGMYNCIRAVLPYMRSQHKGRILNISSVAAEIPISYQAFYSASKAAVNALTLALANEVRSHGISVCALMPGNVSTGFTETRKKNCEGQDVYPAMAKSVDTMEKEERNGMSPEFISKKIFRISKKRKVKPLYATGKSYSVLIVLNRLLPKAVANRIVGKLYG